MEENADIISMIKTGVSPTSNITANWIKVCLNYNSFNKDNDVVGMPIQSIDINSFTGDYVGLVVLIFVI